MDHQIKGDKVQTLAMSLLRKSVSSPDCKDHKAVSMLPRKSISEVKIDTPQSPDITPCKAGADAAHDFLVAGTSCGYPMYGLPISDVMALEQLSDHQTLKKAGKLVKVNEYEFRQVVFLSHEWVDDDHPDPTFAQFEVFQKAIKSIISGQSSVAISPLQALVRFATGGDEKKNDAESTKIIAELQELASDCLVWYDFWSMPQTTGPLGRADLKKTFKERKLAIQSLPYYIGKSSQFLALVPPTRHAKTNVIYDATTYKRCGWNRLEMAAWNLLGSGKPIVFMTDPQQLVPLQEISAFVSPAVGSGTWNGFRQEEQESMWSVLAALVERFINRYESQNDYVHYRMFRAMWRLPFRGCPIAGQKLEDQPATWEEFCEVFNLDKTRRLRGADFKQKSLPPLFYAVWSLNEPMVKDILAAKADVHYKIAKNSGINLPSLDMLGFTVMHAAAMSCTADHVAQSARILQMLVDAKADPFVTTDFFASPIGWSLPQKNDFFWEWMKDNYTPFDFDKDILPFVGASLVTTGIAQANLKLLVAAAEAGANFSSRNNLGGLPPMSLHFSPIDMNYDQSPVSIWSWLLENKHVEDTHCLFDVAKATRKLRGAMFKYRVAHKMRGGGSKACEKLGTFKTVLASRAGSGALHVACMEGSNIEVLQFLIDNNADLVAKNEVGMTALDYAVVFKNRHHEKILREAMVAQNMLPHTTSEDRKFSSAHSIQIPAISKPDEDAVDDEKEEARGDGEGDGDEADGSKDNPYGYDEDEQMDEQEVESLAQIMFDDTNEEKSEKEAAHDEEEDDATEMTAPEEKSGWLRNLFRRGSASKDDGSKSVSSVKTPMTKEQLQETIRNNPEVAAEILVELTKMFPEVITPVTDHFEDMNLTPTAKTAKGELVTIPSGAFTDMSTSLSVMAAGSVHDVTPALQGRTQSFSKSSIEGAKANE